MATCPRCGAELGRGEEVCRGCGREVHGESDGSRHPGGWQPPVDEVGPGSPGNADATPGHRQGPGGGHSPDRDRVGQRGGGPAGPVRRSDPLQSEEYTRPDVEPASRFIGRLMTGVSVVTALIAVFFLPPVFGGVSIYAGYRVYRQYDRTLGKVLVAVGGVATAVGTGISLLVFAG